MKSGDQTPTKESLLALNGLHGFFSANLPVQRSAVLKLIWRLVQLKRRFIARQFPGKEMMPCARSNDSASLTSLLDMKLISFILIN